MYKNETLNYSVLSNWEHEIEAIIFETQTKTLWPWVHETIDVETKTSWDNFYKHWHPSQSKIKNVTSVSQDVSFIYFLHIRDKHRTYM